MMKDQQYGKGTYNHPNLLIRKSHQVRYRKSLMLADLQSGESLLDFGCGDNYFLLQAAEQYPGRRLAGWESFPDGYLPRAHPDISLFYEERLLAEYVNQHGKFDRITCLEVLEHCCSSEQERILLKLKGMLRQDGIIIVSVPVEIGPPVLVKNIFRMRSHRYHPEFTLSNIIKCAVMIPPQEHRQDNKFLSHIGFDFRLLEKTISKLFRIKNKVLSPFPAAGWLWNSQIFYLLEHRLNGHSTK